MAANVLNVVFQAEDRGLGNYIGNLTGLLGSASQDLSRFVGAFGGMSGAISYVNGALKAYQNFNSQLTRAAAVSNATETEFNTLANTALELGRVTEYTAGQVADAMQQMALAGFGVNEIIAASPGLLAMATSGGVQLAQATTIAGQVLRSFHVEASKMNYVSGVLTATFSSTNTKLVDLDYVMKYAGASAAELGTKLSDIAAAAGILGNVGIRGSMTGTGLRQMLDQLGSSLGGMSEQMGASKSAMQQLGIQWADVTDEFGNLSVVKSVDAMEKAFNKMGATAEQRLKILRPIFGIRASSQVTALVSQGAEVLKAKELEVAFGGAKQQLMGFLQQAQQLPEGIKGLKLDSQEMADNFITVGNIGANNMARLSAQMKELGLVGGMFNSQAGVMRERVQQLDGKVIRNQVFTPIEELNAGTLRAVDGLIRLKNHLNGIASEAERAAVIEEIFGADARMVQLATSAFRDGGQAMAEFSNQMLRANSALDVQKKQLDTLSGSFELFSSALDTIQTSVGELLSPFLRVASLAGASIAGLMMQGSSLSAQFAEFQENLGGIERHIQAAMDAWNRFSPAGKLFVVGVALAGILTTASTILAIVGFIGAPVAAVAGELGGVASLVGKTIKWLGPVAAIFAGWSGSAAAGNAEFERTGELVRHIAGGLLYSIKHVYNIGSQIKEIGEAMFRINTNMRLGTQGFLSSESTVVKIAKHFSKIEAEVTSFITQANLAITTTTGLSGAGTSIARSFGQATQSIIDLAARIAGLPNGLSTGAKSAQLFGRTFNMQLTMFFDGLEILSQAINSIGQSSLSILKGMFNPIQLLVSALIFTAIDTLPAIWELVKGIYRSFFDLGSLRVMPQVTTKMAFESGPAGGLFTSFIRELGNAADGAVWLATLITELLITTASVIIETATSVVATLIGLIFNLVAGIPQAFYLALTRAYKFIENVLGAAMSLVVESITVIISRLLNIIYVFAEAAIGAFITMALAGVNAIYESIAFVAVSAPTMILNTILKIYAVIIDMLGRIALISFQLATTMLIHLLRATRMIINAIIQMVLVVATLPVSLPYLAMVAVQGFVSAFLDKLTPGLGAIRAALQAIFDGLLTMTKDIWKEIVGVIISPIRSLVYDIVNIFVSIVGLPIVLATIAANIYGTIIGVVEMVYNYIASTIWNIPYIIEAVINKVFSILMSLVSVVARLISKIVFGVIDEMIRGANLVLRFILGFFIYLPIIIIQSIGRALKAIITGFNNLIVTVFLEIQSIVLGFINRFVTTIVLQIYNAYSWVITSIPSIVEMVKASFDVLKQTFMVGINFMFEELPNAIESALETMTDFLLDAAITAPVKVADMVIKAIRDYTNQITATVSNLIDYFTSVGQREIPGAVLVALGHFIAAVRAFPARFYSEVVTQFNRIRSQIDLAIATISNLDWGKLRAAIEYGLTNVRNKIAAGLDYVFSLVTDLPNALSVAFKAIKETTLAWIASFKTNVLPNIIVAATGIIQALKQFFGQLGERAQQIWTEMWNSIQETFGTTDIGQIILILLMRAYQSIIEWANNATDIVNNAFGDTSNSPILDFIKSTLLTLFDLIREGAKWAAVGMTIFVNRFGDIRDALKRFISGGVDRVGSAAGVGVWALTKIADLLWNLAVTSFNVVVAIVKVIGVMIGAAEGANFEEVVNNIFDALRAYANGEGIEVVGLLTSIAYNAINTLTSVINTMLGVFFQGVLHVLWSHFGIIGKLLAVALAGFGLLGLWLYEAARIISWVLVPVLGIFVGVLYAFGVAIEACVSGIVWLGETLYDLLDGILAGVTGFASGLLGWLGSFLQNSLTALFEDGITGAIEAAWQAMSDALGSVTSFFGVGGNEGGVEGSGQHRFNDFISRPGQDAITFSPNDTIIGVKDPRSLGGQHQRSNASIRAASAAANFVATGMMGTAKDGGSHFSSLFEKIKSLGSAFDDLGGKLLNQGRNIVEATALESKAAKLSEEAARAASSSLLHTKKARDFRVTAASLRETAKGFGEKAADASLTTAEREAAKKAQHAIEKRANKLEGWADRGAKKAILAEKLEGRANVLRGAAESLRSGATSAAGSASGEGLINQLPKLLKAALTESFTMLKNGVVSLAKGIMTSIVESIMQVWNLVVAVGRLIVAVWTQVVAFVARVLGPQIVALLGEVYAALLPLIWQFVLVQIVIEVVIYLLNKLAQHFLNMSLMDILMVAWDATMAFFAYLGTQIKALWEVVRPLFEFVATGAMIYVRYLWGLITVLFNTVVALIMGVWNIISSIFVGMWNLGLGIVNIIEGILTLSPSTFIKGIGQALSGLAAPIIAVFSSIWDVLVALLGGLLTVIGTFFSEVFNFIAPIIVQIVQAFLAIVGTLLLAGLLAALLPFIFALIAPILPILAPLLAVVVLLEKTTGMFSGILSLVSDLAMILWNVFSVVVNSIIDWIAEKISAISNFIEDAYNKVAFCVELWWLQMKAIWGAIGNFIWGIIKSVVDRIKSAFGYISDIISNVVQTVKDKIKGIIGEWAYNKLFGEGKKEEPGDSKRLQVRQEEDKIQARIAALKEKAQTSGLTKDEKAEAKQLYAEAKSRAEAARANYNKTADERGSIGARLVDAMQVGDGTQRLSLALEENATRARAARTTAQQALALNDLANGKMPDVPQSVSAIQPTQQIVNINVSATATGVTPDNLGNNIAKNVSQGLDKQMQLNGVNTPSRMGPQGDATRTPSNYRTYKNDTSAKNNVPA